MTKTEFNLIARLLKSKEPVISAVHLVIFKDVSNAEAARSVGATPQAVHRSTKRFLSLDAEICSTFKNRLRKPLEVDIIIADEHIGGKHS